MQLYILTGIRTAVEYSSATFQIVKQRHLRRAFWIVDCLKHVTASDTAWQLRYRTAEVYLQHNWRQCPGSSCSIASRLHSTAGSTVSRSTLGVLWSSNYSHASKSRARLLVIRLPLYAANEAARTMSRLEVCEPCEDLLLLAVAKLCMEECEPREQTGPSEKRLHLEENRFPPPRTNVMGRTCYLCTHITFRAKPISPTLVGLTLVMGGHDKHSYCQIDADGSTKKVVMRVVREHKDRDKQIADLQASLYFRSFSSV